MELGKAEAVLFVYYRQPQVFKAKGIKGRVGGNYKAGAPGPEGLVYFVFVGLFNTSRKELKNRGRKPQ